MENREHAGKWVDVVTVYGNSFFIGLVLSVKSLAENENGGSGGSGDLRLEKVRSKGE